MSMYPYTLQGGQSLTSALKVSVPKISQLCLGLISSTTTRCEPPALVLAEVLNVCPAAVSQ